MQEALTGQLNNANNSLSGRIQALEDAMPGINDHLTNLVRMVNDNTFVKNRSAQDHSIALSYTDNAKGIYVTGFIDGNQFPFDVTGLVPSMKINTGNLIDLGTGVPCTMPANGWLSICGGGKGHANYYLDGQHIAHLEGEYNSTPTFWVPVTQGQVLTATYNHYGRTYWLKLFPYEA